MPAKILHSLIAEKVTTWKNNNFPHETYPKIAEILDYQFTDNK